MRVITGQAKGAKLISIESMDTRPTLDRIKVTMFDLLPIDFYDKKILDIFSGSGALGIEALSRGASYCEFVDKNIECCKVIEKNLEHTKLQDKANVNNMDISKALSMFTNNKKFDMIFMDPPYDKGFINETLKQIDENNLLDKDGIVVVECGTEERIENEKFEIIKERIFKKMALFILKMK